jgi:hypothetical protein
VKNLKTAMFALTVCAGAVAGCAPTSTPEQQVRDVIAAGEAAAEDRDHRALMALVSQDFTDSQGGDVTSVSQHLRAYLMAHPGLRLATRIDSVKFPYDDMAQVRVTLGTLAGGVDGPAQREKNEARATQLDLAANLHSIELELQRDGDDWKVTRAEWDSLVGS